MDPVRIRREMGCTRAECISWLGQAFGVSGAAHAEPLTIAIDAGVVAVTFHELPPRKLGSIIVPTLAVEFAFDDVTAAARHAFLERFDRYTHRGGG
jgi:hypothetical protein